VAVLTVATAVGADGVEVETERVRLFSNQTFEGAPGGQREAVERAVASPGAGRRRRDAHAQRTTCTPCPTLRRAAPLRRWRLATSPRRTTSSVRPWWHATAPVRLADVPDGAGLVGARPCPWHSRHGAHGRERGHPQPGPHSGVFGKRALSAGGGCQAVANRSLTRRERPPPLSRAVGRRQVSENRQLRLVSELAVKGAVMGLDSSQGHLVAAINSSVRCGFGWRPACCAAHTAASTGSASAGTSGAHLQVAGGRGRRVRAEPRGRLRLGPHPPVAARPRRVCAGRRPHEVDLPPALQLGGPDPHRGGIRDVQGGASGRPRGDGQIVWP